MSARRLDGARVPRQSAPNWRRGSRRSRRRAGGRPGLGIVLAGGDPASEITSATSCARRPRPAAGPSCHGWRRPPASTTRWRSSIGSTRRGVDGILVQSPLPRGMGAGAEQRVFDAIRPDKDVDGFHPHNVGLLVQKRARLVACTPSGVIQLLEREGIPLAGRHAVVIGRSDIVGKPMALLLLHRDATVTICHSRTPDVAALARQADVVVAGVGRAGVRHRRLRAPGRHGDRRRHQPRHRRRGRRALVPRRPSAPRSSSPKRAAWSSATSIPPSTRWPAR